MSKGGSKIKNRYVISIKEVWIERGLPKVTAVYKVRQTKELIRRRDL